MSLDVQQQPVAGAPVGGVRVEWAPVPRVNLLPPEILAARRFRRVQRLLAVGVLGTVVVVGSAFAWTVHEVGIAREALERTQARTAVLRAEEAKYADVPRVLATVEQATQARALAMGRDVLWYRFFDDLAAATPGPVSLTTVTVAMDAAGSTPTAADPLTPAGLGTVSFAGGGDTFPDVSSWLESVASVPGLDGSTLQSATRAGDSGGRVTFTSRIVIAESALSHRYDGKAS